jgi:hypothetical protein
MAAYVHLSGREEALYGRHLLFDNVIKPAAATAQDRFEAVALPFGTFFPSVGLFARRRGPAGESPPTRSPQCAPAAVSCITASAWSSVNVFGFWMGGKSLKVAAHCDAAHCAP